jgi:hypothetical protein
MLLLPTPPLSVYYILLYYNSQEIGTGPSGCRPVVNPLPHTPIVADDVRRCAIEGE